MPSTIMPSTTTMHHQHATNNNYLHCAASKSVLAQNCHFVRQLQRDLPPYPCDVGVYALPAVAPPAVVSPRPSTLDLSSSAAALGPKHPSILKHYKSCPVSPVHEENDWTHVAAAARASANANAPAKALPVPGAVDAPKRHSMYSDDAQTILDMIHSDTEKMIAEITQKYGDLDEYDPIRKSASAMELKPQIKPKPKVIPPPPPALKRKSSHSKEQHGFLSDDDDEQNAVDTTAPVAAAQEADHFSSDSLEDCSLDIDNPQPCRKHRRRRAAAASTFPKRSVSDYFISQPFDMHPERNISLSDILNDDSEHRERSCDVDHAFLSTQRHSSASFFLGPYPPENGRKSQESLLSDDNGVGTGAGSYCNSMESILSDESECKSAPLEALFARPEFVRGSVPLASRNAYEMTASKSYGSSPNAYSSMDFYMQEMHNGSGCDYALSDWPEQTLAAGVTYGLAEGSGTGYPWITHYADHLKASDGGKSTVVANANATPADTEFIPRLGQSGRPMVVVNRSLSKEFADHRQQNNTNPLRLTDELPAAGSGKAMAAGKLEPQQQPNPFNDPSVYVMRKSCSFDIEMFDGRRTQRSANRKYEQNLAKFEKERKRRGRRRAGAVDGVGGGTRDDGNSSSNNNNAEAGSAGGTMAMEYVPHKPPVAARRSSSMRQKRSSANILSSPAVISRSSKETLAKMMPSCNMGEKSFEMYVAEKGACEDMDSVDSLEFYAKPGADDLRKVNSVDSLDDPAPAEKPSAASVVTAAFLTAAEYTKFRDIEKKIDVINKLVELEERKLEQERLVKERRLQPFQCDVRQKGYVKSLTMNFDKLARQEAARRFRDDEDADDEEEEAVRQRRKMKRNFSLPDVLEGAKFRAFREEGDARAESGAGFAASTNSRGMWPLGFGAGPPKQ